MTKETPRDDFAKDDVPGWTPEAVEELNKLPHSERLAARLKAKDEQRYPDQMTRPSGRQGDAE